MLTEWIAQQIAEDEAWARAANGPKAPPEGDRWQWEDPEDDHLLVPDPMLSEIVGSGCASLRTVHASAAWDDLSHQVISSGEEIPAGAAGHIIRHDPRRVLADCQAHRLILADHEHEDGACTRCVVYVDQVAGLHESPCPTVLALAQPYSNRPGWQREWAVPAP